MTNIITTLPNVAPLAEFDMEKLNYLLARLGTPLIMTSEWNEDYDVIVQGVELGKLYDWDELNTIAITGRFRDHGRSHRDYRILTRNVIALFTFREA